MKIVQIITGSSSFGGAEAHVRDLAIGLISRGHECIVMAGPPDGLLYDQLRKNNIPVTLISALRKPIHPLRDILCLGQVLRELRRLRPDVVATHTSKAGLIGRAAAKIMGIPSFFTPHGLSFIDRGSGQPIRFRLLLERIALCLGGCQIAVCDAERRLALDYLAIRERSISTIYNGLPHLLFQRSQLQDRVVITMVARFDIQKDHTTLFRALTTLVHLNWELRLAGTGPLLEQTKRSAQEHGLASRVIFMHQCADVPSLLAITDLFVLISNWEAFPISILEAMRSGLPVIATNTGGVCEAIEHQWNGFLVERGDATQLANYLSILIAASELRAVMGTRSVEHFSTHFEWTRMLNETEALYATFSQ